MSLRRMLGVLRQEYFITKRSLEVIIDLFYFSILSVVVFGFVTVFLTSSIDSEVAKYLFLGTMLWEVIRITQYSVSVGSLWNIWSRNLSNMFITPLSVQEYILSHMLSGTLKAIIIFLMISMIALFIFGFNIFSLGLINLIFYFINLTIFAWSVGIMILGLVFRFGNRIQSLAWGLIFLFQPLMAAFFPLSILPPFLQMVAYLIPPTYVFESARANLTDPTIDWGFHFLSLGENIVYLILAAWFFSRMLQKAKETGQFAKNE